MERKYWFGFRQTHPPPPGEWVPCGPYSSYEEAMRERNKAKAWDSQVTAVFTASNKEEAKEKLKFF
ncbi:hypothetical protein [Desulfurobacterium crinifex]